MSEKGDIFFGFDTTGFRKAIGSMKAGAADFRDSLTKRMSEAAKGSDSGFSKMAARAKMALNDAKTAGRYYLYSAPKFYLGKLFGNKGGVGEDGGKDAGASGMTASFVKGLAIFELIKLGVMSLIRFVKEGIPEIGQAFSIVGNIFAKNLLWPLRKELLPHLQKMLDWTREHRRDFIRWGEVLVNVFKGVKSVAVALWDAVGPLRRLISSVFGDLFGTGANSLYDKINLVVFKIVFLFQIVAAQVGRFASSFAAAVSSSGIRDTLAQVYDVVKSVAGLFSDLKSVAPTLGSAFGTFFEAFSAGIKTLAFGIEFLLESIRALKSGSTSRLEASWERYAKRMNIENEKLADDFGLNDAAPAAQPWDGKKNWRMWGDSVTPSAPVTNYITVTGATPENARKIGEEIGDGIGKGADAGRKRIQHELMIEGKGGAGG